MERRSRTDASGVAIHGSQKQIQVYVNDRPDDLNRAILGGLPTIPTDATITWVSPLRQQNFTEYWDEAFLKALDLASLNAQLRAFWPRGGPHWDALANWKSNRESGVILLEAKAHTSEIYSEKGCDASPESRTLIEASLRRTCKWLDVEYTSIWTGTLYQSANRLAHLFFLRELAKVNASLVNLYFVNDQSYMATSYPEWEAALTGVKLKLGISGLTIPHYAEVFLDAC